MDVLEINNLTKQRGEFCLKNISFVLPKGYIMGYVGQNGAGKSTTIKLIMEQLKHEIGIIKVDGKTFEEDPVFYKDAIGYIADECYLPEQFTVKHICKAMKSFYPSFKEEKFLKLIKEWNLPDNKKIKEFSKGMKARIMFACVLSRDTKLLIMDEATSGLDPVVRTEILERLQDYIEDGERSVLFSTHIMSDLEQVADYIFFLNDGEQVFCDTKEEIMEQFVIVKGGMEELSQELKSRLIGAKLSGLGFEGLLETKDLEYALGDFVIEKPTIEQIVIDYIRGVRKR